MRIALCLSGQPRFLSTCVPLLIKHLIEPNKADVFIHTWWSKETVNQKFDTSIPYQANAVGTSEENVPELIDSLKPVSFLIESPRVFDKAEKLIGAPTAKPSSLCSNFYSQMTSLKLKKQYEEENNFKYDVVIRARIDLWYGGDIVIENLGADFSTLVLYSGWQNQRQVMIPGLGDYTMDDNFAMSSSEIMDKYGEVYSRMEEINKHINPPFAENYLGWNCKKMHDLKVTTVDIPIDIMQRLMSKFQML